MDNIRLAEIRKAQGLSQERLSELSGVARVTIARIETGRTSPNMETMKRLADVLNVPLDVLAGRKGA